ncbi:Spore coat U domain-containing protein [Pandoraea terrae]|uniref:Spore coat U domain-containing protein n=1 Tax=Pandoraea terrae TaxID=1537710 RepID=A0A5E4WHT2_9BURK|nr:spore coat U domain-containing protein [Pandoraea terrae]VVE24188.1 Spore coat U domain-containing protein [Pandoraea terrae]
MKHTVFGIGALVCAVLCPSAAFAGSSNANLGVTASVAANCSITTTPVSFSAYDPVTANATAPLNATGTVSIACTKGAAPTIALGLGGNASGSALRMIGASSSNLLSYALYQPSATSPGAACSYSSPTVWGSSGSNVFNPGQATSKASRTYNVCGQIAGGQDVSVDSYSDTVVATVNF